MSSGPLLEFKVNGTPPGESVSLSEGAREVVLEGSAWSVTPLRKLIIYHNGLVWKEILPGTDKFAIHFSERAKVASSGWFALEAEADDLSPSSPEVFSQALTNCIRVYVGSGKIRNAESGAYFIQWIDKLRAMSQDLSLWRTPDEREHVFAQFTHASNVYRERVREAKQAREKIRAHLNPSALRSWSEREGK